MTVISAPVVYSFKIVRGVSKKADSRQLRITITGSNGLNAQQRKTPRIFFWVNYSHWAVHAAASSESRADAPCKRSVKNRLISPTDRPSPQAREVRLVK